MYKEITSTDFCDWFLNNETYKNNFSFRGLKFLYMHLTNLEEDTGNKI